MTTAIRNVVLVGVGGYHQLALLFLCLFLQGSGFLGPYLLRSLQAVPSFHVTVVSRQSSESKFPASTKIVKVGDAYPKNEMIDVFKGQDAVVLCLNGGAERQHHNKMVDATVEAGIKRLITSTWSGQIDNPVVREIFPFAAPKYDMLEYVKSKVSSASEWSYTAVVCGYFHNLYVLAFWIVSKTKF